MEGVRLALWEVETLHSPAHRVFLIGQPSGGQPKRFPPSANGQPIKGANPVVTEGHKPSGLPPTGKGDFIGSSPVGG